MDSSRHRRQAGAASCLYLAGLAGMVTVEAHRGVASPDWLLAVCAGLSVLLGLLVVTRSPHTAGPALVLAGAAPTATAVVESWGRSYGGAAALPGAHWVAYISPGAWMFHLIGFVVLASNFPSGRLPGRRWAALPWAYLAVAVTGVAVLAVQPQQYRSGGGDLPGGPPVELPAAVDAVALLGCAGALVAVLGLSVASVAKRARAGDDVVRAQLRWFALGAGSVPVLLVAGWVAEALGASTAVAYNPFMFAMMVLLPAAVATGVLRHDLFDVDRLLSGTAAGLLTTAVAAGVFAVVVTAAALSGASRLQLGHPVGLVAAAFVTAVALQPLHRHLGRVVGRFLDHDRMVVLAGIRSFADEVRDGTAEPEQVEDVLRVSLDDPGLQVLLDLPIRDELVRLDGSLPPIEPDPEAEGMVILDWHGRRVGALQLSRVSKRRIRRAREAALECGHAIDVSRLRIELRRAVDEANASRLRLVEAAAIERRRLERDLHDGAQQQILAVGMRLRSVQRRLGPDDPAAGDLDGAVGSLEAIVADLRRLAHGMRPALLDDGLDVALGRLAAEVPLPVRLDVEPAPVSEVIATTAYYVVAEAVANTLKHAEASIIDIRVAGDGERLQVSVSDDGRGGAVPGYGLASLDDRVAAVGGRLQVHSPAGRGTTVEAVL